MGCGLKIEYRSSVVLKSCYRSEQIANLGRLELKTSAEWRADSHNDSKPIDSLPCGQGTIHIVLSLKI